MPRVVVPAPRTTSLPTALANPAYQAALAGNFAVGFSVLGVRSTVVPLLVVQGLDLAAGWIGAAFAVAALVQAVLLLPAGRRSTRSAGARRWSSAGCVERRVARSGSPPPPGRCRCCWR